MDSQWLKAQFRANPDRSKADLAKALGLEPPAISKILNGARQIKAQEYIAMRAFFGLPNDGGSASSKTYALRPLPSKGVAESAVDVTSSQEWVIPASVLNARTSAPPDKIRIFTVNETVMEPDFRHGEHVVVDGSDRKPSPPGVFIISDGYGHMIRHCAFVPGSKTQAVKISAKTGDFLTQTLNPADFEIIGRVIAKLQMM